MAAPASGLGASADAAFDHTVARRTTAAAAAGLEQAPTDPNQEHQRPGACRQEDELWRERGHAARPFGAVRTVGATIM